MNLTQATGLAVELVREMEPYCERVAIAGSIRRGKAEGIKDIEIVAVPKWEPGTVQASLFSEETLLNRLLVWAFDAESRGNVQWIKPGTSEIIPWEPKRDGKYWRGLVPGGIKLDLFLAQPDNFGAIYLIRTGAAEFSQAVVTHGKRIGKPCVEGYFRNPDGTPHPTPEEADVFAFLGLEFVAPERRTGPEVLRATLAGRLEVGE